ncbi:unnamed protein product, partial [Allacma fusca]
MPKRLLERTFCLIRGDTDVEADEKSLHCIKSPSKYNDEPVHV